MTGGIGHEVKRDGREEERKRGREKESELELVEKH